MRARKRDTTALALGSAVSGVLAYVLFAATTRALGPEAAAPVSVLWTYWGFASAALTFPVQHWIARSVTAHGEGSVRDALPRLWRIALGVSLLTGGLSWWARDPLFHTGGLWFPGLVTTLTLGSVVIGVVRGAMNADGRFTAIGLSLIAENGLRCVAVGVLVVADVHSAVGYGICLGSGHLVAIFWHRSVRFSQHRTSLPGTTALAFLSSAALAQLLGQVVLTGGPVVLALAGGAPSEVTALFAALALFRAPYTLALGVVAQLTAKVTTLVVDGDTAALRRIRRAVLGGTVVAVALAGVIGAWFGPPMLQLIFGDEVHFESGPSAVVAIACTVAVANLVSMITVLAHDRPRSVASSWIVAVIVAAVGFVALSALPPSEQIVWCFLLAELAAFAMLLLTEVRMSRSPGEGARAIR